VYLLVGGTLTDDVWWGKPQLFGGRAKERGTWYGVHTSTWTTNIQRVSSHPLIIITSLCQSITRKLTISISNRNIYIVYDNRTRKITNYYHCIIHFSSFSCPPALPPIGLTQRGVVEVLHYRIGTKYGFNVQSSIPPSGTAQLTKDHGVLSS
jgi:hypothetical protein